MVFNHFLGIFLFSITSLTAWSQSTRLDELPGYDIRHFTDENGLPQNSIKSIVRDSNGNIWMATERGLCRYDGNRFRIFDEFGSSFAAKNIKGFYLHPDDKTSDLLALTHDEKWIRISSGKAIPDNCLKTIPTVEVPAEPGKPVSVVVESLPLLIETSVKKVLDRMVARYPVPGNAYFSCNGKSVEYYANSKRQRRFVFEGRNLLRFFRIGTDLYYLDESLEAFRFPAGGTDSKAGRIQVRGPWPEHRTWKFEIYWNNSSDQVFLSCEDKLYALSATRNGDLLADIILEGFSCREPP